jgi:hypothetical protein
MFRTLSALFVAALALVPAVASASGPKSGGTSHTSQTISHTATTSTNKVSVNKTNNTFPTINKGADIKLAKGALDKLGNKPFDAAYKTKFGTKFDHGYFYKGKDHFHWSYSCWNSSYGCYCYWCPSSCCYYYWCQPDTCFYPISYCPYRVYTWPSCYVVPNIPVVVVETVVVVPPPIVETIVVRPAVIRYEPAVVQTVIRQQAPIVQTTYAQTAIAPVGLAQPGLAQAGPGGPVQGLNPQQ